MFGFSQKAEKFKTIIIQTSAECGDCKERLEEKLNYTSGIKFAELDLESKKLTVKFTTSKISEAEIKQIISALGYDADDQKAPKEAVQKLPLCCQPGGMKQ
jgi:copper chaperone CopZ